MKTWLDAVLPSPARIVVGLILSMSFAFGVTSQIAFADGASNAGTSNQPPQVAIVFPPPCCVRLAGGVRVRAKAEDSDGFVSEVRFYADNALFAVITNAPYNAIWSPLPPDFVGADLTVVAVDNLGLMSTSPPVAVAVTLAPISRPAFVITAPTNEVTFAAPATFQFAADMYASDGIDNPLDFYVGTNLIATVADAPYVTTVTNLPEGRYQLDVKTTGGAMNQPSYSIPISITVGKTNNNPPSVDLPDLGFASFYMPASISLAAQVYDLDGYITQVEYFDGPTSLGIVREPPFTLSLSNSLTPGPHYLVHANATDNLGTTISSQNRQIGISDQPAPTSGFRVDMFYPFNGKVFNSSDSISISAFVQSRDNNINPVEFYAGTNLLGSVLGPPYFLPPTRFPAGTYQFSARLKDLTGRYSTGTTATATFRDFKLTAPQLTAERQFQLNGVDLVQPFSTPRSLSIQATTNLVDWVSLATLQTTNSTIEFADPDSTNYFQRFYRVELSQ